MSGGTVTTFVFVKYLLNFSTIECRLCVAAVTFGQLEIVVDGDVKFPVVHS